MSDNTYSLETIIVSNPTFCFSIEEYQKAKVRDMLPCHCIICNKDFYTEKRRINKFLNGKIKNLYCSKPCAFEAAKKPVEKHEPYYCEKCGKFVDSEQYYGNGRFCSELCSRSYASSFVSLEDKRKNFIPAKEKRKEIQIQNAKNTLNKEYNDLIHKLEKWNISDLIKLNLFTKANYDKIKKEYDISQYTSKYISGRDATINFCRNVIQKPITDGSITKSDFQKIQNILQTLIDENKFTAYEVCQKYNYTNAKHSASAFLKNVFKLKLLPNGEALKASYYRKSGKNKTKHERYYQDTRFNIPYKIWKYLPGWDLYLKYGTYNPKTNPDGVDKDHIISRSYGEKHNIDPYLIKHPANCQFLQHNINRKKFTDCSLTIDELIERVQLFNETILDPDFNLDTFPIKTFHSL